MNKLKISFTEEEKDKFFDPLVELFVKKVMSSVEIVTVPCDFCKTDSNFELCKACPATPKWNEFTEEE